MATEAQALAAVLSAINNGLPAMVRAYEPGKVPKKDRPLNYLSVTIVRRAGGSARAGRFSTRGWAAYLLGASFTSAADARNSLRLANVALEGKTLSVGGELSTPVTFNSARQVVPDDDWFSGTDVYHFTV